MFWFICRNVSVPKKKHIFALCVCLFCLFGFFLTRKVQRYWKYVFLLDWWCKTTSQLMYRNVSVLKEEIFFICLVCFVLSVCFVCFVCLQKVQVMYQHQFLFFFCESWCNITTMRSNTWIFTDITFLTILFFFKEL